MSRPLTRAGLAVAALSASLSVSACFTMNASLPGTLRGDVEPERLETVGRFEHEVNHWFIPCGLGTAPETELRKEVLRQVKEQGADGIANMKLEAYNGAFDCLVGRVCPVIQPRTYRLSGDLVRIRKPPLPGQRPSEAPPGGPITVDNEESAGRTDVAMRY
jgi:hypothetical protein